MTLNDEAFAEASQALARRMLDAGETPEEQIAFGVLLATCREADLTELDKLSRLYADTLQTLAARSPREATDHPTELSEAAMANVATVLLNLDEALCK